MSMPGWYPDPSGTPGRFRFWDGDRWSDQTTADPRHAPIPAPDRTSPQRKSDRGWIIALVVLLAVTLIAVVAFVVWGTRNPLGRGGVATADSNSYAPSVPGWDETSAPPPPPSASGGTLVACPQTMRSGATRQQPGKLTADTLQVNQIGGWSADPMRLAFTYDAHWQSLTIYQGLTSRWQSTLGVGLLANADGFTDIAPSAIAVMECLASSDYYDGFTHRVDLASEQVAINGHAAWHLRSEVHVQNPDFPQVQGDVVDIYVVDLGGAKDHLGWLYSCYTIGDTTVQRQVESALSTLTVLG
ncbi:MAG: DUF2510 domain-containing protein [Actinomycetia bacterium]|nr:DUF2510 domain-containing protein [Actinomycetes bacterium]